MATWTNSKDATVRTSVRVEFRSCVGTTDEFARADW